MPKIELRGNRARIAVVVAINGMLELLEELLTLAGYKDEKFVFCPVRNEDGTPGHQGLPNTTVRLGPTNKQVAVRVQPEGRGNTTCWSFNVNVPRGETQQGFLERLQRAVDKASKPQPRVRRPTWSIEAPITAVTPPETTPCPTKALEEARQKRQEILNQIKQRRLDLEGFIVDVDTRRDVKNEYDQALTPYQVAVDQAQEDVNSVQRAIDELQVQIDGLIARRESRENELGLQEGILDDKNVLLDEIKARCAQATDRLLTAEQQVSLEQ